MHAFIWTDRYRQKILTISALRIIDYINKYNFSSVGELVKMKRMFPPVFHHYRVNCSIDGSHIQGRLF